MKKRVKECSCENVGELIDFLSGLDASMPIDQDFCIDSVTLSVYEDCEHGALSLYIEDGE